MQIISITIEKRKQTVPEIQEILTKYGDEIHSRIGLHTVEDKKEFIIIAYTGKHVEDFVKELKENENVKINYMQVD